MLQTRLTELETPPRPAVASPALTYPIALLMAEIGDACDGPAEAMAARITSALRGAAAIPNLLSEALRAPRAGCYARHTIAADPAGRFTLLSIVWSPGQFSMPHAHDTWCAYAVAENTLTETLYSTSTRRAARQFRAIQRNVSRAMLVSPRPGLNKSTGLVMPGASARSRSTPMASRARASERMSTG